MKNRINDVHSGSVVFLMFLVLALSIAGTGCSGGGGGGGNSNPNNGSTGGTIQLSGSVGAGYASAPKPGFFANLLRAVGIGTPAYAALADPVVDQIIAIPVTGGSLAARNMPSAVTAAINADNTFSLTLANSEDWLLVLINSAATGTSRFVGSLALNTGSADSLLNLPAAGATISALDLGVVSRPLPTSNDAISANAVTSTDFNMTAGQLSTLAKTDDIFRNAMNIVNNYEQYGNGTGKWYQLRPDFHWSGNFTSLAAATALDSAPSMTYTGMNFQLDQNVDGVTMTSICSTAGIVALHPPQSAGVITMGTKTYDYAHPITNSGTGCQAWNGTTDQETTGSDVYACNGYQNITYGILASFTSGNIPSGFWEWKENGVVRAAFDLADINPPVTATGQLKGFIPAYKINTDTSNKITSVDVAWYYYDNGTYTALAPADLSVLTHFVQRLEAKFDVTYQGTRRTCEMYIDPTVTSFNPSDPAFASTCQADPAHKDWYFMDTTHPQTNTGLMGFYESGGVGYFFDYFAQ